MSNNSAAIGTMLKTFIASIRSDGAEAELNKLGIKLKEVGTDGVERFRDIQQVILDIAVATKYTNSDIQNVLLKISGGKYQWSKVAAMLSDYKEIVHNWELAINSQGFTEGQVMEQMDTVARKWQTLKDQLEGLIINAGNGGVQDAIKGLIDRISTILEFLNNLSPATITAITKITEFAVAIYACNKAVGIVTIAFNNLANKVLAQVATKTGVAATEVTSLSQAFTALRANGSTAIAAIGAGIKGLMVSTFIGGLAVVIGEAVASLIEYSNKLNEANQKAAQRDADEYDVKTRMISIYKQQSEFVGALTASYVGLLEASKNVNLSEEKRVSLSNDIKEAEQQLTRYIGEEGVARINTADDVRAAAEQEANTYINGNNDKIQSAVKAQEIIMKTASAQMDTAAKLMESYENDKVSFHENIESKIDDISYLASAEISYYKLRWKLQNAESGRLRASIERTKSEMKTYNQQYKDSNFTDEHALRNYKAKGDVLDKLESQLAESEKDKQAFEDGLYASLRADDTNEIQRIMSSYGLVWKNGLSNDPNGTPSPAGGGDETATKEPSSKSSRGSGTRHTSIKDPTVLALESEHDSIKSNSEDRISSLKKYAEKYGASESITMQIDKEYEDMIQKLNDNLYSLTKQLEATSDGLLTASSATTTEGFESFLNAIVGQESGGDYGAIGAVVDSTGDRALGKYQIMQSNWADWAEAAGIGRDADWRVPANQDAVAYHMLKPLYDKYGADGAAVAWYAGEENAKRWKAGEATDYWGRDWESAQGEAPSIARYVREVMARNVGTVAYSQTLKDLGVNESDWTKADLAGKKNIISNLRNMDGIKDNEETQKYLDMIENTILEIMSKIQSYTKDLVTARETKDAELLSNSKAEVEARKTEVSQKNTTKTLAFGLSIRDLDEQRMKLEETKVAYQALNEILPRFNKNTQTYKQLVQETNQAYLDYKKQQKTVIESMYDRREKLTERMFKGKGAMGADPRVNTQATQELTKLMVSLGNLRIKKELMKKQNMLNQDEEWALDDQIEDAAKKVKESMEKYRKTVSDSLESIAEQFVFDGKELTDIFNDAWTALGRDAMKLLFGQKLENPSMLTQMLGYNKADVEKAKEDATKALMDGNTDALGLNTNALVDLTTAINLVTDFLGINKPQMGMGGAPSEVGKSYFTSPALAEFARMNNPALSSADRYSFDSASQLAWSNPSMATDMNSIRGQYTFNTMNDKLVTTNDKLVTGIASLSSNMVTLNTTSLQDTIAQKESTKATGQNTTSTMQLVAGIAGIGNAFANGDWASGLFGLAQLGMGFGWFGGLKATGGKFATGGNMSAAGKVTGAGSGRSDSILAYLANKGKFVMLSNGEYVINEKSAKALGYDTLDQLNGYATGGDLSGSPTNPTPYVPTINQQVAQKAIGIHGNSVTTEKLLREQNQHMIEQNTLLKGMGESGGGGQMIVLNTQASSTDVLKALQENPRAVQAILGRQNRMGFR